MQTLVSAGARSSRADEVRHGHAEEDDENDERTARQRWKDRQADYGR